MAIAYQFNDGGRAAAGFKGQAGDCVCRAIAIAAGLPYADVYNVLAEGNKKQRITRRSGKHKSAGKRTANDGIHTSRKWFRDYMKSLGFQWVSSMGIGSGCRVHLRADELPGGRIIVKLSRHYAAVIDGVMQDTHEGSRGGTRCVYGYWQRA